MTEHEHSYHPFNYTLDDSGYFTHCIICDELLFIAANTLSEYLHEFGIDEEDE